MALQVSGKVGPTGTNAADGSAIELRQGHTGEVIIQNLHGCYFESMARGQVFSAANQAAQAVSVALATTYTGLCLYNPVNSGKILVPLKVKFAHSVAPAAIASIGLIAGFAATGGVTAETTALTARSNQIGNDTRASGRALSAATIVTPFWLAQLRDGFTAASLPAPTPVDDMEGMFGVLPGGFIAIGALTAVTGLASISWEELPHNPQG